jgi:hypothetical protein
MDQEEKGIRRDEVLLIKKLGYENVSSLRIWEEDGLQRLSFHH